MAKRPTLPSALSRADASPTPRTRTKATKPGADKPGADKPGADKPRADKPNAGKPRVDVRAWLGGIRLSGFMLVMMGLVVLAALVLVPTFSTYVQQRQQIAALERRVQMTADDVDALRAQQERWRDAAYITTQARERLYYVHPGEVVYLIDNDLDAAHLPVDEAPVSAEVTTTRTDWMTQMLSSVVGAGTARTATGP